MVFKLFPSLSLIFLLLFGIASGADQPQIILGRWSEAELAQIITRAHHLDDPGERIVSLSRHFLETPYATDTLIGNPQVAEQLVINLAGFDCFTFLDVIEALRRSADLADLANQLKQVRYRGGEVSYANRRHFFSDWVAGDVDRIADVTAAVGQGRALTVVKQLNLKSDGLRWLPEIAVIRREMSYIPTCKIDRELLSALQGGEYVGIYSEHAGLDVSHTGLIVKKKDRIMLRHATSRTSERRVVEVDLLEYLQGKPGLVIYRAR